MTTEIMDRVLTEGPVQFIVIKNGVVIKIVRQIMLGDSIVAHFTIERLSDNSFARHASSQIGGQPAMHGTLPEVLRELETNLAKRYTAMFSLTELTEKSEHPSFEDYKVQIGAE